MKTLAKLYEHRGHHSAISKVNKMGVLWLGFAKVCFFFFFWLDGQVPDLKGYFACEAFADLTSLGVSWQNKRLPLPPPFMFSM